METFLNDRFLEVFFCKEVFLFFFIKLPEKYLVPIIGILKIFLCRYIKTFASLQTQATLTHVKLTYEITKINT